MIACLGSLGLSTGSLAQTKETGPPPQMPPQRLLRFEEAKAIVEAAREHRLEKRERPDCSHLVHEVYQTAGFEYPFATSNELYAGAEGFKRVPAKAAQRGDLIVWRGHVGIVVEAALRAFYSSVRSGLRLDFYDSAYWRKRGPARFYRYARRPAPLVEATIAQAIAPESTDGDANSLTTARTEEGDNAKVGRESGETTANWPDKIFFRAAQAKPAEDEVAKAIDDLQALTTNSFRHRDLLGLDQPVVIVDQMNVERVEVKGSQGWALIRADLRLFVRGDRTDFRRAREKRMWELRRTGDGWMLKTPKNRAYVPRDAAVTILAAQLATRAQAAQATGDRTETQKRQATAVRMLSAMVDEK